MQLVLTSLLVACTLVSGTVSTTPGDAVIQARTRSVYVSVIAKDGSPVTDLQAADFEVKEGGKKQEILGVKAATDPLRVAILVADAGTGAFQLGVANFIQDLLGHGEFSLTSVVVQPEKVVDYSSTAGELTAGIKRVGNRGGAGSGQLLEAIDDAIKDVRREARRPVIVVLRTGGEATTTLRGDDVRERLRKSGAILYVVSTVGAQRPARPQARATDPVSQQQGQMADDEIVDGALNLGVVLGDGSRDSGGRHDQIISTTLVPAMRQIARELLRQYEITYAVPTGARSGDKISVTSTRNGVTVRAPSRIPN